MDNTYNNLSSFFSSNLVQKEKIWIIVLWEQKKHLAGEKCSCFLTPKNFLHSHKETVEHKPSISLEALKFSFVMGSTKKSDYFEWHKFGLVLRQRWVDESFCTKSVTFINYRLLQPSLSSKRCFWHTSIFPSRSWSGWAKESLF